MQHLPDDFKTESNSHGLPMYAYAVIRICASLLFSCPCSHFHRSSFVDFVYQGKLGFEPSCCAASVHQLATIIQSRKLTNLRLNPVRGSSIYSVHL